MLKPYPCTVTVFGDRAFTKVLKFNEVSRISALAKRDTGELSLPRLFLSPLLSDV